MKKPPVRGSWTAFSLGKQTNKNICVVNKFSVLETTYFYLNEEIYEYHNV